MTTRMPMLLCLSVAACGPQAPAVTATGDTSTGGPTNSTGTTLSTPTTDGATFSTSGSTGGLMDADTTTEVENSTLMDAPNSSTVFGSTGSTGELSTTGAPVSDEQLCQSWCDNLMQSGCGDADDACHENCREFLMLADTAGCSAERRAAVMCEADQPFDVCYQSSACVAEYFAVDLCFGEDCSDWESVRGGSNWEGVCTIGAEMCYGHDLEMRCPAVPDAQCTCWVDEVELGVCALGLDLDPDGDTCITLTTYSGCCNDLFHAALVP